jgi:mycothiol synthase
MNFVVRNATLEDVDAITELRNAVHLAEVGRAFTDRGEVRNELTTPGHDPALDDWMVFDGDEAVGCGSVISIPPYTQVWFQAYVRPGHTGRGVGVLLQKRLEERAASLALQAQLGEPVMLMGWSWDDGPGEAFLRHHGFEAHRRYHFMEVALRAAPPPPPVWPQGIEVRTMIPGEDDEAIWRLQQTAFRDHYDPHEDPYDLWHHWTIEANERFDPSLWFLACDTADGGRIVGDAICVSRRPGDEDAGFVDDLCVLREYRGRGIATALLRHAFGEMAHRGLARVALEADAENITGAMRLYERAGMTPAQTIVAYRKEIRPARPA